MQVAIANSAAIMFFILHQTNHRQDALYAVRQILRAVQPLNVARERGVHIFRSEFLYLRPGVQLPN
jgi:hypothetical protein